MLELPEGLRYFREFLTEAEHDSLLAYVRSVPFKTFSMQGRQAKRHIAQYGYHYSFDSSKLKKTEPLPEELLPVRERLAVLSATDVEEWAEALVTEYPEGAGIGWHKDAESFGLVAGLSLGSACRMRFRRGEGEARETRELRLEPGSLYILAGEARSSWEHHIPDVKETRYSITFRTLRRGKL